jgi:hypothetical protein
MYSLIGKATVKLALLYVRRRYRRQGRIALGVVLAAAAAGAAYLVTREVPEG